MPIDPSAFHALIFEVPPGEATSYDMIASLIPSAGPQEKARMVSHALIEGKRRKVKYVV